MPKGDLKLNNVPGDGAFGNADPWIDAAIHRALRLTTGFAVQLGLVDYREPHPSTRALLRAFGAAPGA